MKKFIYFPLWKIEDVEKHLEGMEQNGYRLEKIKHSYFFYFKESPPKQTRYFLSYKSFRGRSMGNSDYFLLSNHSASPVESKMSFYEMYRTKETKENMILLYAVRSDFIKSKLLWRAITLMFLNILFLLIGLAAIITQSNYEVICYSSPIIGIFACSSIYCFHGYLKQRNKCKEYERNIFDS